MNNKTKNILIALLVFYVTMDIGGVFFLYEKKSNCVNLFFELFREPKHLLYMVFCFVVAFVTFKQLK
jgi:hypothetical protein